ncbi:MAG: hypothetical protein AAGE52_00120 [Myxococcota bacterium]
MMNDASAALVALVLLEGCYLAHSVEDSDDAGPDAYIAVDAAPELPDAGALPVTPGCHRNLAFCDATRERYVFRRDRVRFGDIAASQSALLVAFDHGDESTLASLTPDLALISETPAPHLDWPEVAWHPGAQRGIAAGADVAIGLDERGRPTRTVEIRPFGLHAFRTTPVPVPSGFLLFVSPQSGGRLRGSYGALVPSELPANISWDTFREDVHASLRVVPALDEFGYARALGTGDFNTASLVLWSIDGDRPGEIVYREPVGSGLEPEALLHQDDGLVMVRQSRVATAFSEVRGGEITESSFVDGERIGGPIQAFGNREADALAFPEGHLVAAQNHDNDLLILRYQPDRDLVSTRISEAGFNRLMPRLAHTPLGYAVSYQCGPDAYCVESVNCCEP